MKLAPSNSASEPIRVVSPIRTPSTTPQERPTGDAILIGERADVASPAVAPRLSAPLRLTAGLMACVMGTLALGGCTPKAGSGTQAANAPSASQTQADQKLADAFAEAQKAIAQATAGNTQQAAQDVTRKLVGQIQEYAQSTHQNAQAVSQKVEQYAITHPAVAITVLLAVGATGGALLEKAGVPENVVGGTAHGLSAVQQWVNDNPLKSLAIGAVVAATVGYLIYEGVTPSVPSTPQTAEQKTLVQKLDALEQEASTKTGNVGRDAKSISSQFMDAVQGYAQQTHEGAQQVTKEVGAYLVSHPGVTAAVIFASGVSTGVILQQAGVPATTAVLVGAVVDSVRTGASDGLAGAVQTVKDHPLGTAIGAVMATGAAYLLYQHMAAQGAPSH